MAEDVLLCKWGHPRIPGQPCKTCASLKHARYRTTAKSKARIKRYKASDKGRATEARYRAGEKGRAAAKRHQAYMRSAGGLEVRQRYNASAKGWAADRRYDLKGAREAIQVKLEALEKEKAECLKLLERAIAKKSNERGRST